MKRSVAVLLVQRFKSDGHVMGLGQGVVDYLYGKYGYLAQPRVQQLLGARCKRAADAIWDGNDCAAVDALVRFGLRDKSTGYVEKACNALRRQKERMKKNSARSAVTRELFQAASSGPGVSAAKRGGYR